MQKPTYFGPRGVGRLTPIVPALALWRARDGVVAAVTPESTITAPAYGATVCRHDARGRITSTSTPLPSYVHVDLDGDLVLDAMALWDGSANPGIIITNANAHAGAGWTAVNTGAVLTPTLDLGDFSMQLLSDTSGSLQQYWERSLGAVAATNLTAAVLVAEGSVSAANGSALQLYNSTGAATIANLNWTWSGGIPVPTATTGTYLGKRFVGTFTYAHPTTNVRTTTRVWVLYVQSTTFTSGHTILWREFPASTAAQQGNQFFGQGYYLAGRTTGMPPLPNGPAGQDWKMAFTAKPQPLTLAVRFVDTGMTSVAGSPTIPVAWVGNAGATGERLYMYGTGGSFNCFYLNNTLGTSTSVSISTGLPKIGDEVILRAALLEGGQVVFGMSVNGGAEVTATSTALGSLGTAWGGNEVHLSAGSSAQLMLAVGVLAGAPTMDYVRAVLT